MLKLSFRKTVIANKYLIIQHPWLFQDREHPYVEDGNLSIPKIEANFAEDLPEYETLHQFSGVDGFLLKTDALYEVNSGYQWYLQVRLCGYNITTYFTLPSLGEKVTVVFENFMRKILCIWVLVSFFSNLPFPSIGPIYHWPEQ